MSILQVVFFSSSLRSNLRVDFWGRVYGKEWGVLIGKESMSHK